MSAADEPEEMEDDKTIDDDTLLYRRVMNQPCPPVKQIIWDDNTNCWRPSSAVFTNHPDGSPMSIALGDTLEQEGLSPDSVLIGHENFSLVSFPAYIPRSKNQGIMRKPLENDPAHGEVFGKKTGGVKKTLQKNSTWYKEPDLPKPE